MKSFEQLGQVAFEAHVKEVERQGGFKAPFRKPQWSELQPEFRQGWIAAAKQLWDEFSALR
jgi:hypothetical protein